MANFSVRYQWFVHSRRFLNAALLGASLVSCAGDSSLVLDELPVTMPDNSNENNVLATCIGEPLECFLSDDVGVYRITMSVADGYSGPIEVFAESRRLMFEANLKSENSPKTLSFLVDVRDPEGDPFQNDIGIPGLNLRITQGASALSFLSAEPSLSHKNLFLIGDSTVTDQSPQLDRDAVSRYSGWGQFIPSHFNDEIVVANYAVSGEGTYLFRPNGGDRWGEISARMQAQDWVMIQLGHNDKQTSASQYRSRITNMITAIKEKGANAILISPMIRNTGVVLSSQHIWGDLNIRAELINIAQSNDVPLVDLMKLSHDWASSIGQSAAQTYFVAGDKTHSNEKGARFFAQMIIDTLAQEDVKLLDYKRLP